MNQQRLAATANNFASFLIDWIGVTLELHYAVEVHVQGANEVPVFLAGDLVKLQYAVRRVAREVTAFHCLFDGVVFGHALLCGVFREVEVEFRVVALSVLRLRGDVVAVDVRTDGIGGMPYFPWISSGVYRFVRSKSTSYLAKAVSMCVLLL